MTEPVRHKGRDALSLRRFWMCVSEREWRIEDKRMLNETKVYTGCGKLGIGDRGMASPAIISKPRSCIIGRDMRCRGPYRQRGHEADYCLRGRAGRNRGCCSTGSRWDS